MVEKIVSKPHSHPFFLQLYSDIPKNYTRISPVISPFSTSMASVEPAFMGFVMPEAPRPMAKIKPEDKGDTNLAPWKPWP